MKADVVELIIYVGIAVIGFFLGLFLFVGTGTTSSSAFTAIQDGTYQHVVLVESGVTAGRRA